MNWGIVQTLAALLLVLLCGRDLTAQEYGSAARVNDVEISLFRLERHFEDYLHEQRRSVAQIRNPSVYKRLKREALEQLIDKELLWQEAQNRAIAVDDAEVARTRAAVAAGFSSPATFERRLQAAGFDEAAYTDYLRREIAASRMLDQLVGTVTVSDEEVRRAYAANREHLQLSASGQPLSEEQGLALVRRVLLQQRDGEARRAALDRLRAGARIEVLVPL
ncbi:peptidylprolyl isomerase [compost metagenome]